MRPCELAQLPTLRTRESAGPRGITGKPREGSGLTRVTQTLFSQSSKSECLTIIQVHVKVLHCRRIQQPCSAAAPPPCSWGRPPRTRGSGPPPPLPRGSGHPPPLPRGSGPPVPLLSCGILRPPRVGKGAFRIRVRVRVRGRAP